MTEVRITWPQAAQPLALQAIMFDLDGTMVDTMGDFDVALNAMLRDLQLPAIERGVIQQLVGKGSEHLIRQTLAHVGASANLYEQAFASYQQQYGEINGEYSALYPGVREGLQHMASWGVPLACLTNKPQIHAEVLLQRLGIADFFQCVFGGDAFARKKPDPMPLLETAKHLGTAPAVTLMVGDSSNDAQAAHAANCPIILVDYGYNHGQPIQNTPANGYIASFTALTLAKNTP